MIRFHVFKDGSPLSHVDVRKDEIVIGRGVEADVQLTAEAVSRRHARLTKTAEGWQVADLGAANGVYVSRAEGTPERVVIRTLVPGDQIHIESFVLTFDELDEPTAPVPKLDDDFSESSLETKRTQFISMVDVLAAREALAAEGAREPARASEAPRPVGAGGTAPLAVASAAAHVAPSAAPFVHVSPTPPATSASPAASATWWVHLSSTAGHQRTFTLQSAIVRVGSASHCEVRLPEGPAAIAELDRAGDSVSLRRVSRWPFPRVHVDGRAVREALLSDGDSFVVGDFEVRVCLRESPRSGLG